MRLFVSLLLRMVSQLWVSCGKVLLALLDGGEPFDAYTREEQKLRQGAVSTDAIRPCVGRVLFARQSLF